MAFPRTGRYTLGARAYDVVSAERLGLRPGDRVLDVGCGTGLNLPLLRTAVGDSGRVVGLDRSTDMLAMARRRVSRHGWTNVDLVESDAERLPDLVQGPFDAALATYVLSIIEPWRDVWAQARALVRPGGRMAIVDLSLPSGAGTVWWPLARLVCWTGGADPHREPWRLVADLDDVTRSTHRAGHVVTAVGTRR